MLQYGILEWVWCVWVLFFELWDCVLLIEQQEQDFEQDEECQDVVEKGDLVYYDVDVVDCEQGVGDGGDDYGFVEVLGDQVYQQDGIGVEECCGQLLFCVVVWIVDGYVEGDQLFVEWGMYDECFLFGQWQVLLCEECVVCFFVLCVFVVECLQ